MKSLKSKLGTICLSLTTVFTSSLLGQTDGRFAVVTGKMEVNRSNKIQLGDSISSIAKDGTFRMELMMKKPGFINFSYEDKNQELFISPGDTIDISVDGKDFYNSISVDESEPRLNGFLVNQRRSLIKTNSYLKDSEIRIFTSEPSEFLAIIDSMKQDYSNNFEKFLHEKDGHIDDWFAKKTYAEVKYHFERMKLWYPARYRRYSGKDPQITSKYFIGIAKNAFDDPDLLDSKAYLQFVDTYLNVQSAGKYKTTDYMMYPMKMAGTPRYDAIVALRASQRIEDYLLTKLLKNQVEFGTNRLGALMDRYKKDCRDNSLREEVLKLHAKALERRKLPSEIEVFKKINDVELEAHIFYPDGFKKSDRRPLYVFFHGGAWNEGNPEWGYGNCQQYASRGMVAISFEYRLIDLDGVTIPDCIDDAKSAIRWARQNANGLGIDSERIVAEGFSSGGHLAACTAIIEGNNDKDSKHSCKPNALILKSTPYSVVGYSGMKNIDGEPYSPLHKVEGNMVPAIMFHGTNDRIVPFKDFGEFVEKMKKLGNSFVYHSFEGADHFDLLNKANGKVQSDMIWEFLIAKGFLRGLEAQ